jgi:hypothetical protein
VTEHLVADGHMVHAGADGLHDAGGVAAEHDRVLVRQAHLGQHPGGDAVVDRVQAGGLDPDQDGALGGLRGGQVGELGLLTGGGNMQSAHDGNSFK